MEDKGEGLGYKDKYKEYKDKYKEYIGSRKKIAFIIDSFVCENDNECSRLLSSLVIDDLRPGQLKPGSLLEIIQDISEHSKIGLPVTSTLNPEVHVLATIKSIVETPKLENGLNALVCFSETFDSRLVFYDIQLEESIKNVDPKKCALAYLIIEDNLDIEKEKE